MPGSQRWTPWFVILLLLGFLRTGGGGEHLRALLPASTAAYLRLPDGEGRHQLLANALGARTLTHPGVQQYGKALWQDRKRFLEAALPFFVDGTSPPTATSALVAELLATGTGAIEIGMVPAQSGGNELRLHLWFETSPATPLTAVVQALLELQAVAQAGSGGGPPPYALPPPWPGRLEFLPHAIHLVLWPHGHTTPAPPPAPEEPLAGATHFRTGERWLEAHPRGALLYLKQQVQAEPLQLTLTWEGAHPHGLRSQGVLHWPPIARAAAQGPRTRPLPGPQKERTEVYLACRLSASRLAKECHRALQGLFPDDALWLEALRSSLATAAEAPAEWTVLDRALLPEVTLMSTCPGALPQWLPPDLVLGLPIGDHELLANALEHLSAHLDNWRWDQKETPAGPLCIFTPPAPARPGAIGFLMTETHLWLGLTPLALKRIAAGGEAPEVAQTAEDRDLLEMSAFDGRLHLACSDDMAAAWDGAVELLHMTSAIPGLQADPALLPPAAALDSTWAEATLAVQWQPGGLVCEAVGPGGLLTPAFWLLGQTHTSLRGMTGLASTALWLLGTGLRATPPTPPPVAPGRAQALREFYRAARHYQADHNGLWPPSRAALETGGYLDTTWFPPALAKRFTFVTTTGPPTPTTLVAYAQASDESPARCLALFGNGEVARLTPAQVQTLLRAQTTKLLE